MGWLKRQKFWKVFFLAWGFMFVWDFIVAAILYFAGAEFSQHVAKNEDLFFNSLFFLPLTTMAALLEEIIFRWGPMLILSFVLMWMYQDASRKSVSSRWRNMPSLFSPLSPASCSVGCTAPSGMC